MTDQKTNQFRLKFDETNSMMTNEILEQRVEKLSTRITIISILIPVLFGVVFTIAYLNIKKRVYHTQHSGIEEIEKLSKDWKSRFSSLSENFAGLEDALAEKEELIQQLEDKFSQKIVPMEKITTSILEELKTNQRELSQLQTSKVDKKEFNSQIASVKKSLSITDKSMNVLQNDMKDLITTTNTITENFKEELKTLTDFLEKEKSSVDQITRSIVVQNENITEIRQELSLLSQKMSAFAEKGEMRLAIKTAMLELKVYLDEAIKKMNQQLKD